MTLAKAVSQLQSEMDNLYFYVLEMRYFTKGTRNYPQIIICKKKPIKIQLTDITLAEIDAVEGAQYTFYGMFDGMFNDEITIEEYQVIECNITKKDLLVRVKPYIEESIHKGLVFRHKEDAEMAAELLEDELDWNYGNERA